MTRVFVDSDILLDFILQRVPYFNVAADIIQLSGEGSVKCFSSVHGIVNVHYFAKKIFGEQATRAMLLEIMKLVDVVTENSNAVKQALTSEFSDFEDAVQYQAALNAGANYIITRNLKDYKHSAIPVMTAEQFLRTIYKA
ncbi:PIN domain-containing protein [Mucilaginibacter daejeonensis]|uniref:PIN domain-containing protein n=1 Tax=Mucilaginibacter daejeonensis TaxID=398049 RepID=UPI001D176F60|nr:PIN domain-containing protein [Mucilaginibacter daejeonensis]UEG53670.1 PIN domain-containing protein [Mucilaginibacter daejeonensis]